MCANGVTIHAGKTLLRRYRAAVSDRNAQEEAHRGISTSLEPHVIAEWTALCVAWDADGFPKSATNPFHVVDTGKFAVNNLNY